MARRFKLAALQPHPLLSKPPLMPPLSEKEYADLKASIGEFGVRVPIVVAMPEGIILDGHHRYRASLELDLEEIDGIPEEFMSPMDQLQMGVDLNASRRQWHDEESRKASAELVLKEDPAVSDRTVARIARISPTTAAKVRKDAEKRGDVSTVDTRKDKTGRRQQATKPPKKGPLGKPQSKTDQLRAQREAQAEELVQQNPAPQAVAQARPVKPSEAEQETPEPDGGSTDGTARDSRSEPRRDEVASALPKESPIPADSEGEKSAVREVGAVVEAPSPSADALAAEEVLWSAVADLPARIGSLSAAPHVLRSTARLLTDADMVGIKAFHRALGTFLLQAEIARKEAVAA